MPISSTGSFDRWGEDYKPLNVIIDGQFDVEAYKAYSPLYISMTFALSYGLSFGALTSTVVHTWLWYRHDIVRQFRSSMKDETDVHSRLMLAYPEVPQWWYVVLGLISFALGIVTIEVWDTKLPVWAFILSLLISLVYLVPVGMIQAITNQQVGLNVITELIVGYMLPGKPVAMMIFKTFGYITMTQALAFVSDLKLGHYMKNKWRPAKCSSVEKEPSYGSSIKSKSGSTVEPDVESLMGEETADKDDTTVKIDRNYEYSVFVSYAEIYNEKIFDLLASDSLSPEVPSMSRSGSGQSLARSSHARPLPKYLSALLPKSLSSHLGFGSSGSISSMAGSTGPGSEMPGTVTRKALALKSDPTTNGKFISGLREIRVRSAQEGRAILKLGQINRTVFGTVANEQSSRSHAVFTIKVLRVHKGADKEDPEEVHCARLSVVDLAGSERSKNTHATGDRLKEAGNINKSLMVLGQCMEMLRANQRKTAAGGTAKLGVVPFRHSKLTELFMDFFVGEGRAVMIVNVNPYDTGFDENSHVMRFSALAREVATTTQRILPPRPPPAKSSGLASASRGLSASIGPGAGATPKIGSPAPVRTARKVRLSEGTPAETVLQVVEEDETGDEDDDDVPRDTLVDELFEEVDYLRERLYEAEMRASTIEAEIREEVMKEMEERMQAMEKMFMRRLASEVEAGEIKTDRKIDMLQRAGRFQSRQDSDSEDEENIEKSLMVDDVTESEEEDEDEEDEDEDEEEEEEPESPTPQHRQLTGAPLATLEEGESFEEQSGFINDEAEESGEEPQRTMGEASMDIADDDEEEIAETPEAEGSAPSKAKAHTPRKQRIDSDDEEYEQEDEEDEEEEYVPTPPTKPKRDSTNRTPKSKSARTKGSTPTSKVKRESSSPVPTSAPDQDGDESMTAAAIVPNKRVRAARLSASGPGSTYIPAPGEPEAVKKKKRQLGKVSAMTEEQIWAAAMKVEHEKGTMGVRRFGRGSR
ncbi:unnamed protein product [Rhizoctonia solani]|uniref:Kinesin-like protein n=1 Tax=Rhizoctonia solani TaxID=456999 RepID=A0A8H3DYZ6_9AGAM|nr:unnamed protein product [Rhizoctonia solani]